MLGGSDLLGVLLLDCTRCSFPPWRNGIHRRTDEVEFMRLVQRWSPSRDEEQTVISNYSEDVNFAACLLSSTVRIRWLRLAES